MIYDDEINNHLEAESQYESGKLNYHYDNHIMNSQEQVTNEFQNNQDEGYLSYIYNNVYGLDSWVHERLDPYSHILSPLVLGGFIYANPIAFSVELGSLFLSGLAGSLMKAYSVKIANLIGINEELITNSADFIQVIRWPLVGIAAAVTSGGLLKTYLHNEIIIKTLSTSLATLFIHSFMNISPISTAISEGGSWYDDINSIFKEGAKKSLERDAIFFSVQKLVEDRLKGVEENILISYEDNILNSGLLNSIYRSLASSFSHYMVVEANSNSGRHVMVPLEFLSKSFLDKFLPAHNYVNHILPAFLGGIVKYSEVGKWLLGR